MKIAGITAEYNPLHFGHLYHIRQTKAALGEDAGIVCVMSGNFMQRGDVAILEKHARAEAAVRCGADLVLELPLTYALASAERFAYGAMSIFDALGNVGYISFGSESGDVSEIERAADVLLRPEMDKLIVENLKDGTSYAAARMASAEKISGRRMQVLVQPNDILAVEYGKAIRRLNSDMELLPVKRQGAGHDSLEHAERISAMELRRRIACGDGVEEPLRNQGLGSAALDAVKRLKPGRRLIADLEAPLPDAPNRAQRLRRRTFYRRAGFVPSGVSYRWQGESYELMVFGGALDEAAFLAFWRHFGVTPKTGGSF